METKVITLDNIQIIMVWGEDKKLFVTYTKNYIPIKIWNQFSKLEQKLITVIIDTVVEEEKLTKWSY